MYVGQNDPVELPSDGKLHIQKNGYVYWSNSSRWDKEKRRSVDNRVSIGKLVPDNPKLMYPNRKYFDIFGVVSEGKKDDIDMGHMLKNLDIENFRGIKSLKIKDMRRIVLLSGKNNVGKSSILEAIFFIMDHLSPDSFNRMNSFRGMSIFANDPSAWEPLFYQMNPGHDIQIRLERRADTLALRYSKDDSYIPAQSNELPQNIASSFRSSAQRSYTLRFDFNIQGSDEYSETGHFSISENGLLRELADKKQGEQLLQLTYTIFLNNGLVRSDRSVPDRMGRAEMDGRKGEVIDCLKLIDSSVSDIVTLSVNGIPQLFVRTADGLLPVQFSGDGINKLLQIVLSIMDARDGIVLIDEVDTGFHYSMYPALWEIISRISKDCNCQVVATTHSYENILAAVEGIKDCAEDFAYYRLGYDDRELKSYRYNYDLLKSAFRSNMEIR